MIKTLTTSRDRQLGILVSALLLTSLLAFVGQVYDLFTMRAFLSFVSLPGAIVAIGLSRWAVKADHLLYYRRLMLGIAFGVVATVAYDVVRLVAQNVLPVDFNAFAIHAQFGSLITGSPVDSTTAKVVGWSYHISNGLTFAICFALVAGPVHWKWGVLYGLTLQAAMVSIYPKAFGVERDSLDFLAISFLGHGCYGFVLGRLNQRFNVHEMQWIREHSG